MPVSLTRRGAILGAMAMCLAAVSAGRIGEARAAEDESYLSRPIRILVPFGAGSQMDIAACLVGGKFGEALRQQMVVDNRPGASGNIGADLVAKSPPDGYTLLMMGSEIRLLPNTLGKVAVDPLSASGPECVPWNPATCVRS